MSGSPWHPGWRRAPGQAGPKVPKSSAPGTFGCLIGVLCPWQVGPPPARLTSGTARREEASTMSARVADVMTTNAVAVRANASFKEIAARLREYKFSAFPVLDNDDRVIGVVSEADLLPKEALEAGYEGHRGLSGLRHRAEREKATGVTAAEIMSRPPVTIGPHDLVSYAAHLMYDHRITCLPVVEGERLVGVITRADVLSVFERTDADIRRD